jgi:hypothetical protein
MNDNKVRAPIEESVVYIKGGITYVPHHRNNKIFVGPGYPKFNLARYSENQLLAAGAEKSSLFLWPRGTTGVVNEVKP